MGVMLSLDRPVPAPGRHQGQHVRNGDGPAGRAAAAGRPRYAADGRPGRHLSRMARAVLASWRRPAAVGGAVSCGGSSPGRRPGRMPP